MALHDFDASLYFAVLLSRILTIVYISRRLALNCIFNNIVCFSLRLHMFAKFGSNINAAFVFGACININAKHD